MWLILLVPAAAYLRVPAPAEQKTDSPLISFPARTFMTPDDPLQKRMHFFVLGPETSGTRLVSQIIAEDADIPNAVNWEGAFATADPQDAIFHVSLPWGSYCEVNSVQPVLSSWGGSYPGNGVAMPPRAPARLYVNIKQLIQTYKTKGEAVEVVLVARDPEVSLLGKIDAHHCSNRAKSVEEQDEAFRVMLEARSLPDVTIVCYEELVSVPKVTLTKLRRKFHLPTDSMPHLYDANAKYSARLPNPYPCTYSLRAYNQLCPTTALAKQYPACK